MRDITWRQIVLVLGLTGMLLFALLILTQEGKDAGSILGAFSVVLLAILAVFGNNASKNIDNKMEQVGSKIDEVKDLSNGRLTEALNTVNELHAQVVQLAMRMPPPEAPVSPAGPSHDDVPKV